MSPTKLRRGMLLDIVKLLDESEGVPLS